MKFEDAVRIATDRSHALQSYWTFYATGVGGVLAFFGAAQRSPKVGGVLTVAFIALAAANLWGMYDVTRQRRAVQDMLEAAASADAAEQEFAKAIAPPAVGLVVGLHLLIDLVVIGCIWWLVLYGPGAKPPLGGQ